VRFPKNIKQIPKNSKLTLFKQLNFLHEISLLFFGSADVATDIKVVKIFVSLWILVFF